MPPAPKLRVSLSKRMSKKSKSGAGRELVMNEKQGTLSAYGARFLLIPVKLIHSIEDRLTESLGSVTATSFEYEIGREGGSKFIQLAQKAGLGIKTAQEIQRVADVLGTMSGWGKIDVVDFDFSKKSIRIGWK